MAEKTKLGFNYSIIRNFGTLYKFAIEETETEVLIKPIRKPYSKEIKTNDVMENQETMREKYEIEETIEDDPFVVYLSLIEDMQNDMSLFPEKMQKGKTIIFDVDGKKVIITDRKPSQVLTELMNLVNNKETLPRSENRFKKETKSSFDYAVKNDKSANTFTFEVDKKENKITLSKLKSQKIEENGYNQTAEDLEKIILLTLIEDIKAKENLPENLKGAKKIFISIEKTPVEIKSGKNSETLAKILNIKNKVLEYSNLQKEILEKQDNLKELNKKLDKIRNDLLNARKQAMEQEEKLI